MFFKKGYKRSFFGRITKKKNASLNENALHFKDHEKGTGNNKANESKKDNHEKSLVNSKLKAELSLSLKGDKQPVSLVCLKIKNFEDIETKKGNTFETLAKIINVAEEQKAYTYENHDNLIFILAPAKTRTFKNETTAIELAQAIKIILLKDNKLFKQKIEFGISLHKGNIIAKQEKGVLEFMSLGTLITTAKKISYAPAVLFN